MAAADGRDSRGPGGGTGMVGDPSGKRNERPTLSAEQVDAKAAAIRGRLGKFLDFSGNRAAQLLNNAAWLRELHLLDFLRDTGSTSPSTTCCRGTR